LAVGLGVALVPGVAALAEGTVLFERTEPLEEVATGGAGAAMVGAEVAVVGLLFVVGGAVGGRAMTLEGPNGVSARAIETTRATVTAGYATTARTRTWRVLSLFMLFTFGSSVG
jgi:hypothetical protein